MSCPKNGIRYNGTLCACPPGQLLDRANNSCFLFGSTSSITTGSVENYDISFPETIISFDPIRRFTQSQAVVLEATAFMLLSWLFFCIFLRFMKLGDGRSIWFRMRWWVSRLDLCFATRHWLDDQKVVTKRKTELGGTFSIASWILFIGLFAALLYQILSKRSIEVHNVKAANAPELASFVNDMDFSITTVSTMSCANIRDLGTVVFGTPGLVQRMMPLTNFANFSCQNKSEGPTINVRCESCRFVQDEVYISWQFIDLPSNPASAVGFQFNLSTADHAKRNRESFVSGILKNGSNFDDRPVTFRGRNTNILHFNLFPRIYRTKQDLKIMQPLFHEFIPGSSFQKANELQASLGNANDGLLNITLYINLLSSYIVEVDEQTILGPVGFLADLGGLYCISVGIFFYLLVQFEYRIKRFRNEDSVMRKIRNRRKAQEHWDKLRKYVTYTWGCSTLDDDYNDPSTTPSCSNCMVQSSLNNGSSRKRRSKNGRTNFSFNKEINGSSKKTANQDMKSSEARAADQEMRKMIAHKGEPLAHCAPDSTKEGKQRLTGLCDGDSSKSLQISDPDNIIPLPPSIGFKDSSDIDMSQVLKSIQNLYEYNAILREKLVATQQEIRALTTKPSPETKSQT